MYLCHMHFFIKFILIKYNFYKRVYFTKVKLFYQAYFTKLKLCIFLRVKTLKFQPYNSA